LPGRPELRRLLPIGDNPRTSAYSALLPRAFQAATVRSLSRMRLSALQTGRTPSPMSGLSRPAGSLYDRFLPALHAIQLSFDRGWRIAYGQCRSQQNSLSAAVPKRFAMFRDGSPCPETVPPTNDRPAELAGELEEVIGRRLHRSRGGSRAVRRGQ